MSRILLATHSKMASGMKASIDLLLGDSDCLTVYDAYLPGADSTVQEVVEKFLASGDEGETILLVSDVKGGSVNQAMLQFAGRPNVFVITGITLGLLMELVSNCDSDFTEEQLNELVLEARQGTQLMVMESAPQQASFF